MRLIWKHLPVFIIWLTGVSMTDAALHRLDPPLHSAIWLGVVPLMTTLVLLAYALAREKGGLHLKRYLPWAAGLSVLSALVLIPRGTGSIPPDTHRLIYEASAIAEFLILALHGRTWLKGKDWVWVFGITLVFGMILENGGIFMGFFREEGYLLSVPFLPAPMATMVGWTSVLYCGFYAVERVLPGTRPLLRGLSCALIGLALDLAFDPVATRMNWWVWNHELSLSIWGVPVVNYVAWFWALFPYAWCYYAVRGLKGMSETGRILRLILAMPALLVLELCGVVLSLLVLGDQAALGIVRAFFHG